MLRSVPAPARRHGFGAGLERRAEKSRHGGRRQDHRRQTHPVCAGRHVELHGPGRQVRRQATSLRSSGARRSKPRSSNSSKRPMRKAGHQRPGAGTFTFGNATSDAFIADAGQPQPLGNLRIRRPDTRRDAPFRQGQAQPGFGSGPRLHQRARNWCWSSRSRRLVEIDHRPRQPKSPRSRRPPPLLSKYKNVYVGFAFSK